MICYAAIISVCYSAAWFSVSVVQSLTRIKKCLKCLPHMCSLEVILANRLVLNLRTHSHSHDLPNPTTKTDMFFRQAYGGSRIDGRFQTAIDSVLGNIGAPLRVGNEPEDRDEDVLEVPYSSGEREHYNNTEDGVDPLGLERTRSRSEQEAVNGGEISEF